MFVVSSAQPHEVGKKDTTDLDLFHVTALGMKALNVTQCLDECQLLAGFRLERAPEEEDVKNMSEFEFLLALTSGGWTFEMKKPSKKTPPYRPNADKVWFWQSGARVNTKYLETLLKSDT